MQGKNSVCWVLGSYWLIIFGLFISISGCTNHKKVFSVPSSEIAEGDIVFRKGNSTKTRAVLHADTAGIYSHVGMVVRVDSAFMVVHITPGEREPDGKEDKIKLESLDRFFAPDRAVKGAMAHFSDSSEALSAAVQWALEFYKRGVLFDNDYDLEDSTRMYCTEMVWRAYLKAGRDITDGARSEIRNFPLYSGTYIFPSDVYKNKKISVYYEF